MSSLNVAVIGCGNIAKRYGQTMAAFPQLKLVGATDLEPERAQEFVAEFGGTVYATTDDLLADKSVDLVVNLTIHQAHVEVVTKCLNAGKHVFSEKPLALSYDDAKGLVELANAKGLRLGSAPITFMGEAQQTAWKLIREGKLGKVRVAYAEVNWARIEKWHPNPVPFYAVGPLFDVAVYPLTIVTTLFGPARRVTAYGTVVYPDRVTKDGTPFHLSTPDFAVAVIEHADGTLTRLTANFYVPQGSKQHGLEFHGDLGSLYMDTWHDFNSRLELRDYASPYEPLELVKEPFMGTEWARGVADMAAAITEGRPHRATGVQAAHVVDIISSIMASYTKGGAVEVKSDFPPPAPMDWAQ